jgi:hypothetical protein
MGGSVRSTLGSVGGNPLGGAGHAAFFVAQGALHPVAQDVQHGAVFVGGNGVGHVRAFGLGWQPLIVPFGAPVALCPGARKRDEQAAGAAVRAKIAHCAQVSTVRLD